MSRRIEIDALRGLMLVTMTLTHLPTRLRLYSDQPFGFVSAAEGFVFLSAFVVAASWSRQVEVGGVSGARRRLWGRAARVYGHHLGLLAFAFTIAATLAAAIGRPGLRNLLAFYFDFPAVALVSGPLLLYQPPLLDILPLYVVFLTLTPALLEWTERRGFVELGVGSVMLWSFAQLGGRELLHAGLRSLTGIPLPLDALGAFDLLAWQLIWMAGLWAGSARVERVRSPVVFWGAALAALGFFLWRHQLGVALDLGARAALLDKWHLGALRVVNFASLAVVMARGVLPALRWLRAGVLSRLGQASLPVFSAHVLGCLLSLALVSDDVTQLSLSEEALVLIATFGLMAFVAWRATLVRPPACSPT